MQTFDVFSSSFGTDASDGGPEIPTVSLRRAGEDEGSDQDEADIWSAYGFAYRPAAPDDKGEWTGLDVDAVVLDGRGYIPHTGALPRCTWYGIRVVGPWREGPKRDPRGYWRERWERQQRGEEVDRLRDVSELGPEIHALLARRATIDGSEPRPDA